MHMKLVFACLLLIFGLNSVSFSQTYNQLSATDAVSGILQTLPNLANEKGVVLIFHDPSCPFAKLYENRIKSLVNKFQTLCICMNVVL